MADEINLKKLAEQLNLSIATVSRALRDSHEISTETKERVLALARKLDYQPNPFGSGLRQHKSKTIAVIIPEVANSFFSLCVKGIEEVARENGYHVLMYLTHESHELETSLLRSLGNGRVDGVLMSVSKIGDTEEIGKLPPIQTPLVVFDRVTDDAPVSVTMNDFESAYQATQHLIECGCKKIAFLSALKNMRIGQNRYAGYKKAMQDNGLDFNTYIVDCGNDSDKNYELISHLLTQIKPDGIVSSMERLAKTCYLVCYDLSLNIPGDVKIISFSSLDLAPILNPSLTTITQPAFEMGCEAARILLKMIKNKNYVADSVVLSSVLMKRNSTCS